MKRREFVTSVLGTGLAVPIVSGFSDKKGQEDQSGHGGHGHDNEKQGGIVHVSFGHWLNGTPLTPFDRFPAPAPAPINLGATQNAVGRNVHVITPNPIKARVGDTLVFHISGLHNPQIFGPGTQPQDINRNLLSSVAAGNAGAAQAGPAIIDDNQNGARFFRGLDPRILSNATTALIQDRVESVSAPDVPGRYLVICGVLVHFFIAATSTFGMFAFMDVEPAEN